MLKLEVHFLVEDYGFTLNYLERRLVVLEYQWIALVNMLKEVYHL